MICQQRKRKTSQFIGRNNDYVLLLPTNFCLSTGYFPLYREGCLSGSDGIPSPAETTFPLTYEFVPRVRRKSPRLARSPSRTPQNHDRTRCARCPVSGRSYFLQSLTWWGTNRHGSLHHRRRRHSRSRPPSAQPPFPAPGAAVSSIHAPATDKQPRNTAASAYQFFART